MAGWLGAAAPEQPVPFSHKTHTAAAKLVCQDCHPAPAKFGADMGFPATATCMACHILIAKEKPAIRKLAEFAAARQPIPWVRVYRLKDFVFFDHRYHLMNQAKCEDCHGPVTEQDATSDELIRSFSLNPSLQAVLISETGNKTERLQGLATWGDALRLLGE